MKIGFVRACIAAVFVLTLNSPAAITVNNYWRMGENDGASPGTVLVTTTDIVGGKTLTLPGGPICNSAVASGAASHVGSTLGLNFFTAGVYGTNAVIPSVVNNFGIECWVKPSDTTGNKCLLYNGDTGFNGWGIYQIGATYQCLFGGVTFFGSAPVTAGTWVHLALVRNNGTATFYVNGVSAGTTASAPNNPTGMFGIAAKPTDTTQDRWVGVMDELRFFTFAANQFSTSDLLLNASAPSVTTLSATSVGALGATLNASVNPGALSTTVQFKYGTTTNYGSTVSVTVPAGTSTVTTNASVVGLSSGVLYHFRAVAINSAGTSNGSDLTFTTTLAVPAVTTLATTSLTGSNATLNASVNPNGFAAVARFQWGSTPAYGNSTAITNLASGASALPINAALSNLQAGRSYHYRALATNATGSGFGWNRFFGVPAIALNGSSTMTNAYGVPFVDAGATLTQAGFALSAGGSFGLVLKADGTVSGWGDNGHGEATGNASASYPYYGAGLWTFGGQLVTNVVAISAGSQYSLAILSDSTVVGSGYNGWFEARGFSTTAPGPVILSGLPLSNVVAVAASKGGEHSVALKSDGTFVGWGRSPYGEAGNPFGVSNLVAVAAGEEHTMVLSRDGIVTTWGRGDTGQNTVPAGLSNVIAIAAGNKFNLALRSNGTVVAWGDNGSGQTNVPASVTNVIAIAGGYNHALALKADGTVTGWGDNSFGQVSIPAGLSNVVAITAGSQFSLAMVADGTVVGWGSNYQAQRDPPQDANAVRGTINVSGSVNVSVPGTYTLTYTGNTNWLGGVSPAVTRTVTVSGTSPIATTLGVTNASAANATLTASVNPNGFPTAAWFQWGNTLAYGNTTAASSLGNGVNAVAVATTISGISPGHVYHYRVLATNSAGTAIGWDKIFETPNLTLNGPLSITNFVGAPFADPGAGISASPLAISASYYHTLALKGDGKVVGWGRNLYGETNTPIGLSNAVAISCGATFNLALRSNGTVFAWGDNSAGQTNVPANLTNAIAIAACAYHSLVLRNDGTVAAWGGTGLFGETNVPTSLSNVVAAAGGNYFSLALKSDGTVAAWGVNDSGQTSVPGTVNGIKAIAAGAAFGLAVKSNGTVVGWGANNYDQTTIPPGLSNVIAVAGGGFFSMALRSDGTVVAWGQNGSGQTNVPSGLSNVVAIAAGWEHAVALQRDGTIVAWGANNYNQSTIPSGLSSISGSVAVSGSVNTNSPGTYMLTYSTTNFFGAVSSVQRNVMVIIPPFIVTQTATNVTDATANLVSTVNPNGTPDSVYFQYGTTTNYGSVSSTQALTLGGMTFNGVSQYASGTLSGLNQGNVAHTIEAWLKPTLAPANREWVAVLGAPGSGAHHWLLQPNGFTQIGSWNGAQANPTLASNVWTHLAASFDGTTLRVYTNGVLVLATNASFNLSGGSLTLAQQLVGESFYGGGMDEVRIWNLARSASEIQSNYNVSLVGNEPGLLGYYRLNELSGSTLNDSSGNTNTLQAFNNPTWNFGAPMLTTIAQNLSGLADSTTYHFRTVVVTTGGTIVGADRTFTTDAGIHVPSVTTLVASEVAATAATLNALVNPSRADTTVYFEYGLTTNYGSVVTGDILGATNASLPTAVIVADLSPSALFHFRVVASNSVGISFGQDLTFTTAASSLTAVRYYRLGEDDAGATVGALSTTTHDRIGGQDLSLLGSPEYSADVTSAAAQHADSSMSLDFSNGNSRGNGPVISLNDSFGFEVWVKPAVNSGSQFILYTGDPGFNGWGLQQNGDTYQVLFGGVEFFGSPSVTLNEWTHLAVVRDNGVATFYVNGVAVHSTSSMPNVPTGSFYLCSAPNGGEKFSGVVDEVRVFTFAPGFFSPNDLLLNRVDLPTFSNVGGTSPNSSGATLGATVRPNGAVTAAWFEYGLTTNYGSFTSTNTVLAGSTLSFSKIVSGLSPNVTYHFRAAGTNSDGYSASPDFTFFTASLPAVTTLPAGNITATNATLPASVNPSNTTTTVYFQYGTTTNYGETTAGTSLSGGGAQFTSNNITGLTPGATYHFRAVATNNAGLVRGADVSFTTPPLPPVVTTLAAGRVRVERATLNGSVNPNGGDSLVWFQFGTTTDYGYVSTTSSVPAGATAIFSNVAFGLGSNTLYHYRAVAMNSAQTTFGSDLTFTTPSANVTNIAFYRLGDGDSNAIVGNIPNLSSNSAGTSATRLEVTNGVYSADVSSGAHRRTGTSVSMDFRNGYARTSTGIQFLQTDNFIIEAWAKPTGGAGSQFIVYNGQPTWTGWGIQRVGDTVMAVLGTTIPNPAYPAGLPQTTTFGSTPIAQDQWTHVALVRDSGLATFYVNGVAVGSSGVGPSTSNHRFVLATRPDNVTQNRFSGLIDEVRLATFAPGMFDPSDLLYAAEVPRPAAQMVNGQFQIQFYAASNATYNVLTTTNIALPLTNWINLGAPAYLSNGVFQINLPTDDRARFFELQSP